MFGRASRSSLNDDGASRRSTCDDRHGYGRIDDRLHRAFHRDRLSGLPCRAVSDGTARPRAHLWRVGRADLFRGDGAVPDGAAYRIAGDLLRHDHRSWSRSARSSRCCSAARPWVSSKPLPGKRRRSPEVISERRRIVRGRGIGGCGEHNRPAEQTHTLQLARSTKPDRRLGTARRRSAADRAELCVPGSVHGLRRRQSWVVGDRTSTPDWPAFPVDLQRRSFTGIRGATKCRPHFRP